MNAQKYTQKSLEAVQNAQSIATEYGNQQIEQPHLLLALLDTANRELKELFRTYNVQKEGVLQALTNVRGNQRVTSDNPEETYNALKKYGAHRRARRGQDRHRRGAGPAHRQGGRPRLPEGQDHFRPGYGFPDRRGQVPRRV